jgi:hypothetical protein
MTREGSGLDTNSKFPGLKLQLISGETMEFPGTGEGYRVFLIYRGHW